MSAVTESCGGVCDAPASTRSLHLAIEGARDITPMVVGVIPLALAIGGAIGASSLSRAQAAFSAAAILAGTAQLATIDMLDGGVAPGIVIVSAILINARIILYSAALAPWFSELPLGRRLLLALPVIDQLHFTCTPRFSRGDLDAAGRTAYYVGAASWLVSAWVLTQIVAIMIGANIPAAVGLQLAAPLSLAGLLARSATSASSMSASLAGALLAVTCAAAPMHSSVLIATLAGIVVGRCIQQVEARRHGGVPEADQDGNTSPTLPEIAQRETR
jgi:predicted branched-subunit amino acid permease